MIQEKGAPEILATWTLLFLAALGVLVFLSQWHRLFFPLGDNEGFYGFYALQMARGLQLYRDLWDHKPPGLFLQYFLLGRVMPLDEVHLRLYACVIHILNALLLAGLGRKLGFGRVASLGAGFIYVLFLFPALLQPWSAEADLLGLPFLLTALVLAFSPNLAVLFLSGACFSMAFLTKQSVGLVLPAFLAVPGLREPRKAGAWAGGAALGLGAVLFPYFLDGRFPELWDAFSRFNRYYVSHSWDFFLSSQPYRHFESQWFLAFLLLYGVPLAGFVFFLFSKSSAQKQPEPEIQPKDSPQGHGDTKEDSENTGGKQELNSPSSRLRGEKGLEVSPKLFLGLWLFGALASCFLSAYFFSYYFIALLPPLSLALAYGLREGVGGGVLRAGIFCGWVLGAALATGLNLGGAGDRIFSLCQYATGRLEADREVGSLIRQQATPGNRLFCWACEPSLYAYAGLPMAVARTPVINHLGFLKGDAEQAPARFEQEHPEFCVVSHSPQVLPEPGWLVQALDDDYMRVHFTPDADTEGLELYVLKEGKNAE